LIARRKRRFGRDLAVELKVIYRVLNWLQAMGRPAERLRRVPS
jgi:hypothetical protein